MWVIPGGPMHSPGLHYERGYYGEGAGEMWLEGSGLFYYGNKDEGRVDMGLPYWFICLITDSRPPSG